ncbi:homeobox protein SIX4 [Athene cunicularia]|uniref:homeobox protein SIX4 n=1 Tax=Athene cunicularia TaxID=194338 RepID=UPI000EF6E498|nr:homeobox protein SIX4 [Athene cunicularia]
MRLLPPQLQPEASHPFGKQPVSSATPNTSRPVGPPREAAENCASDPHRDPAPGPRRNRWWQRCCRESESDGNPSTEDESSKGQEDLSPHPLPSSSDSVTSLSLPGHTEPVYMQQLGNTKIALSSSGVLLNGNLVPASTSPVFLNGSSFLQGPNGVILNGLSVGASQTVTLNSPKTTSSVVSNGVSITDILSSSSEDVKDFKLLQASVPNATAATFSPSNIPVSFPGLIPSSEVKRESVQTAASQDGGSVVTFTAPVQINQYGIVQIPNSGTNGQLLNGSIGFSSLQLPPVSVAASQGNVSVNPSTSDGGTFTTESSTVQQGKVFFSPLTPSAVVYTVPNSGQAVGSVKQEGLERSLVFSQLMPVSQNTQLNVNMSSENISSGGLQSLASSLVNVTPTHNFSLTPTLLNAAELNSGISESQSMSSPMTSTSTVISISNTNYATLQNCSLITSQDLLSISTAQPALGEIISTSGDRVSHPSAQVHQDFVREHSHVPLAPHSAADGGPGGTAPRAASRPWEHLSPLCLGLTCLTLCSCRSKSSYSGTALR